MHRCQLTTVSELGCHLVQGGTGRDEAGALLVYVGAVDLVGYYNDAPLHCECDDGLDGLKTEYGAGRIAWVDDADGTHRSSSLLLFLIGALELLDVELPAFALVEVVGGGGAPVERNGGTVERVLRNWNHDCVFFAANDALHHEVHSL